MKLSEQWLRQWINLDHSVHELTEQMTLIGLEVDEVLPVANTFSNIKVGEVVSTQQHPNADKLTCCQVDVGLDSPLSIVCGAPNVRAGLKVPVAVIGAVLPGDFKIKKTKLRGELSEGMICSANELGLAFWQTAVEGILELPSDAPVGEDFAQYFQANDHVIDIEITPNRGDCLGIRGIARDLAAVNAKPLQEKPIELMPAVFPNTQGVAVQAKSACPRYVGRMVRGVNNHVETPSWMQIHLQRAGVRPINPVVDICNYVMIELGQPMHGFDLKKLSGDLSVRFAKAEEKVQLLDEQELTLSAQDLVIADDNGVHALAGVMGAAVSGVEAETTDVFLESAFFDPKTVCLSSRRHGLSTDSSYRFERGVDSQLQLDAIERATALLVEIAGGDVGEIEEVVSEKDLPVASPILLRSKSISRLLGIEVDDATVSDILTRLGMTLDTTVDGFQVTPPSYRFDINLEVDLVEEVVRLVGYNHIPATQMTASAEQSNDSNAVLGLSDSRLKALLVDKGYHEAITYSFIDPTYYELFSAGLDIAPIKLSNPLSQDLSLMRPSLWPGLLQALQMNQRHQSSRVRLFETGLSFLQHRDGEALVQLPMLAMVATGSVLPEQWSADKKAIDFYDMKSDVMALFALGQHHNITWQAKAHPALHPGRSAAVYVGETCAGYLGELHPAIAQKLSIKQPVIMGSFLLDALKLSQPIEFKDFSKFPAVRRDLAIVIDEKISVATIKKTIRESASDELQLIQVFDVYQGGNVEDGKKSIALGLTFQDASRTLRDEEINEIIHGVVTVLNNKLNATLRA